MRIERHRPSFTGLEVQNGAGRAAVWCGRGAGSIECLGSFAAYTSPGPVLILYLDHGDLCGIGDGKARAVDDLRAAIRETETALLVSCAHAFDMVDADADTRRRWVDAVWGLGTTVYFAIQPGQAVLLPSRWHVETTLDEALQQFEVLWRTVHATWMEAATAGSLAFAGDPQPPLEGRKLRQYAERALAERPELAVIPEGVDVNEILGRLAEKARAALARGLAAFVHRRRGDDRERPPADGDLIDEMHLLYVSYSDVFTCDKNVAHILGGQEGTTAQLLSLDPTSGDTVFVRNGRLARVASHLRRLRDASGVEPGQG